MRYTFGHTNTAAERLKAISDFFNPLAEVIIHSSLKNHTTTAADMGCGPGYTTDMLARATRANEVTGIDISSYFLELAKQAYPDYQFVQDDVTRLKPTRRYDFIYCRFLLSHLQHIDQVLTGWLTLLNNRGILFIDELEGIETDVPVFLKYLETNNKLIRSQGADLYIGSKLDTLINGYSCIRNSCDHIPVADSVAAGWFFPNSVSIWKDDPVAKSLVSEKERKQISEELYQISQREDNISHITWRMKRILLTI